MKYSVYEVTDQGSVSEWVAATSIINALLLIKQKHPDKEVHSIKRVGSLSLLERVPETENGPYR